MSAYSEDFNIDGVTGAAGELSNEFYEVLLLNQSVVCQTYRARRFLKFVDEVCKRHKHDYGKKSRIDLVMRFVEYPGIGPIFVIEIGDKKYGLCPTTSVE